MVGVRFSFKLLYSLSLAFNLLGVTTVIWYVIHGTNCVISVTSSSSEAIHGCVRHRMYGCVYIFTVVFMNYSTISVTFIVLKYISCVIVILCVITVGIEQHDVIIEDQSRDITLDFVAFSFKFS